MVRHGVRVPEDFAIVGYDDIDFAAAAAVPLSSVRKPRQELGRRAAELLLDEARDAEPPARAAGVRAAARRPGVQHGPAHRRRPGVKVALFATCLVDTMVPQVARATAALLRAAGPRGRRPAGAELLRADARQHRLPPRGRADRGQPRARVRRRGGDRRAVRVVRGLDPPPAGRRRPAGRGARAGRRGRRAGRAAPTSCPSSWSTSSGSPTSAPTTRTGSPTTRPATRCGCCGSATGRCSCCAPSAGWTWSSCPAPTSAAASAARSR